MNPRTQDTSTGYLGPYLWYKTTSPGSCETRSACEGAPPPFLQLQRIGLLNSGSLRSVQSSYIYAVLYYYYTHGGNLKVWSLPWLFLPPSLSAVTCSFFFSFESEKRKCKNGNLPCAFSYVSKRMVKKKIWWDKISCGGSWASRCIFTRYNTVTVTCLYFRDCLWVD